MCPKTFKMAVDGPLGLSVVDVERAGHTVTHSPYSRVEGEVCRRRQIAAQHDGVQPVVELEHVDLEAHGVRHVQLVADPVDSDCHGRPRAGQHDVGGRAVGAQGRGRRGLAHQ